MTTVAAAAVALRFFLFFLQCKLVSLRQTMAVNEIKINGSSNKRATV
jgi:hypothetical protein